MVSVHLSEPELDHWSVAVLKPSEPARPDPAKPGRKLSECIAPAKVHEAKPVYAPIADEDFAKEVQAGIDARRDSFEPPAWD